MLYADGSQPMSQGQRQLLAIARAAIARPAGADPGRGYQSSIDTRTEISDCKRAWMPLWTGRTVFVIAHRLSTVKNAQAILVLEKGKIIERGDHRELLEKKGVIISYIQEKQNWIKTKAKGSLM